MSFAPPFRQMWNVSENRDRIKRDQGEFWEKKRKRYRKVETVKYKTIQDRVRKANGKG